MDRRKFVSALGGLVAPLLLITAVLGSILTGLATPTEAAGVGAFGALLLAAFGRHLDRHILRETVRSTTRVTALVFMILIGASLFSLVFRAFGGDETVEHLFDALPGGVLGATLVVMLIVFLLGFILDFMEITFVVVPIVGPVLLSMGVGPGVAGGDDRAQPADLVPDAAVRLRAVLSARRGAAGSAHLADL